jgi:hypothetical protein
MTKYLDSRTSEKHCHELGMEFVEGQSKISLHISAVAYAKFNKHDPPVSAWARDVRCASRSQSHWTSRSGDANVGFGAASRSQLPVEAEGGCQDMTTIRNHFGSR